MLDDLDESAWAELDAAVAKVLKQERKPKLKRAPIAKGTGKIKAL